MVMWLSQLSWEGKLVTGREEVQQSTSIALIDSTGKSSHLQSSGNPLTQPLLSLKVTGRNGVSFLPLGVQEGQVVTTYYSNLSLGFKSWNEVVKREVGWKASGYPRGGEFTCSDASCLKLSERLIQKPNLKDTAVGNFVTTHIYSFAWYIRFA